VCYCGMQPLRAGDAALAAPTATAGGGGRAGGHRDKVAVIII
jgi:hypothetical protein